MKAENELKMEDPSDGEQKEPDTDTDDEEEADPKQEEGMRIRSRQENTHQTANYEHRGHEVPRRQVRR